MSEHRTEQEPMSEHPLISVLVPIYNVAPYLEQCLQSLADQIYSELEIICIDDGSTDGSTDIINRFVSLDKRFHCISKSNSGYGDSMNHGLDYAHGSWIAICEPDDYMDTTMLETLLAAAQAHSESSVDIVKGSYNRVVHAGTDEESIVPAYYLHAIHPDKQPFTLAEVPDFTFYHPSIWSALYRRDFLNDYAIRFRPIPGAGWADNPFFIETLIDASAIVYVDKPLYFYREFDDGTLSHQKDYHIIVDRWIEMNDILRDHKVTAPGIWEGHYNCGCSYIQMLEEDFDTSDPQIREAIQRIAERIDYDAVYRSSRILQVFKDAYQRHVPLTTRIGGRIRLRRAEHQIRLQAVEERSHDQGDVAVSILVPIYNAEHYLDHCLDQLSAQTLKDIEIICINDGSTDTSAQIIQQHASRDSRIRVITKANSGYGDSMNKGIAAAHGTWIGICEPDDFADVHMFETYYRAGMTYGCDLVKSNYYEHVDANDAPDASSSVEHSNPGRADTLQRVFDAFPYGHPFDPVDHLDVIRVRPIIWSALYRRSMLINNDIMLSPTPGASFQDTSFVQQCWIAARRVVLLEGGYLHYRIDNDASSSKSNAKVFAICGEYERTFDFLRKRGAHCYGTFAPMLNAMRFDGYTWNYSRIAPLSHRAFAQRWAQEMKQAQDEGSLDVRLLNERYQKRLSLLLDDVDVFCRKYPDTIEL
ncbi:MAG: glycosyltransferase [Eggerthellaceae bacterium]|jgi:glycosyltransferase involved in cell wall biosynthesis|nr:glycosyltransferase [Eggerthellaceae bacterium]MCH4220370.1 glycosyltransferase [Eggerthellaceae bacterium]